VNFIRKSVCVPWSASSFLLQDFIPGIKNSVETSLQPGRECWSCVGNWRWWFHLDGNPLHVAALLLGVDMPHNIVWQAVDTISSSLGHLGEPFGLCLVLKCVAWEVDARSVDIGFDENVDAADAVKLDLLVLVVAPIAHASHVGSSSIVLLVTFIRSVS